MSTLEEAFYAAPLVGRGGYVEYRRLLNRVLEMENMLPLFDREEAILEKPTQFEHLVGSDGHPFRWTDGTSSAPLEDGAVVIDPDLSQFDLRYALRDYEDQQKRLEKAEKIIIGSVSPDIAIKLQNHPSVKNAVHMLDFLEYYYGVPDEKSCQILEQLDSLDVGDFRNITAYLCRYLELQLDLTRTGMIAYTDEMMIVDIVTALPGSYDDFKNQVRTLLRTRGSVLSFQTFRGRLTYEEKRIASQSNGRKYSPNDFPNQRRKRNRKRKNSRRATLKQSVTRRGTPFRMTAKPPEDYQGIKVIAEHCPNLSNLFIQTLNNFSGSEIWKGSSPRREKVWGDDESTLYLEFKQHSLQNLQTRTKFWKRA